MKKIPKFKIRIAGIILLVAIFLPGMLGSILPSVINNSPLDVNDKNEEYNSNKLPKPRLSKISTAPWWNGSWRYRRLINVTNSNINFAFTNYTTSIVFNYTVHTVGSPAYQMNGDLSDIRIVQDGLLRKYYYKQDYPNPNFVTVWFDVDIDQYPDNIDTDNIFLYFNGSAKESVDPDYYMDAASNNKEDSMGWIRNGDFELDYVAGNKISINF